MYKRNVISAQSLLNVIDVNHINISCNKIIQLIPNNER